MNTSAYLRISVQRITDVRIGTARANCLLYPESDFSDMTARVLRYVVPALLIAIALSAASILYDSDASDATVTASGTCGDDLDWQLEDGVLTITGTGAMADYALPSAPAPWYQYRDAIASVVFGDGVTTIGEEAFCDCGALASVEMPESRRCPALPGFGLTDEMNEKFIRIFVQTVGFGNPGRSREKGETAVQDRFIQLVVIFQ